MPMHKISADDGSHTELYVSEATGEVAVMTTRASRALAWVSAIPHWLYLEVLRRNGRVWRVVVLWTSGLGTVLSLMGIILAIIQYSRRPPHIPYAGWMRWHYITGAVFGVFTLTWVFSGFLSMEPWDWASEGGLGDGMREAFSGGPLDLTQFPAMDLESWNSMFPSSDIKEIEFLRIQGNAYYLVRGDSFEAGAGCGSAACRFGVTVFHGVSPRKSEGSQPGHSHRRREVNFQITILTITRAMVKRLCLCCA